jgi:hypothetical protein
MIVVATLPQSQTAVMTSHVSSAVVRRVTELYTKAVEQLGAALTDANLRTRG